MYRLDIIGSELRLSPLFEHYQISKQSVEHVKSPNVFTSYDTTLISPKNNRWLFVRIEDYDKYQKVIFWVNLLDKPRSVNFDLERYFYENLKIKNVNQKFIFRAPTSTTFQENIRKLLNFIYTNIDANGKAVLMGNYWLDMSFDWAGYK